MNYNEKDKANIWHPFTSLETPIENIVIDKAKGIYLYTEDGRKIMDAVSSWWVNILGHSRPEIAAAIGKQAAEMEHIIFAGFTHKPAIELSETLLSIAPDGFSKVFFSDNGSTSVEVAIKMAMQYWYNKGITTKKKIIALDGAYHGDTFGAMSVGARDSFNKAFEDYLFEVEFLPFPDEENSAAALKKMVELVDQNNVAAFIYEPLLQGSAGMRIYPKEVLDQLITIAKAKDVICIADEVMTGFGRTGKIFASDHLKNNPDIMSMSKGITGGFLPLGITAAHQHIVDAFATADKTKTFYHGHSYTGNPISCAAANATLKLLLAVEAQADIQRIEKKHLATVGRFERNDKIKKVSTLGTVFVLEIKNEEGTSYFNSIRDKLYNAFLDRDILLRPLGNIIYILPPYCITNGELERVYITIEEVLSELS